MGSPQICTLFLRKFFKIMATRGLLALILQLTAVSAQGPNQNSTAAKQLIFVDDIVRMYNKPSQVAIILEQSIKQGYLFYLSADQYGKEWKELFNDGFNDTDIEVITHDLRVLLEELEFFTQWLIRDGEDLVFPWVNYTSREMIDQYVFNYTFAAGEIIELSGQTAFRTYRIVEEAYIDVNAWIRNWQEVQAEPANFTFSYVSRMFRDVRTWSELALEDVRLASLKLNQVMVPFGVTWDTTVILENSMEWLVLVIDWIDEMVEFINLAFAAVLEPIIGAILNGQSIDLVT